MSAPTQGFSLMAGLITVYSRGSVTLTGAGPHDPIAVDLGALADERDLAALAASVRLCREIGRAPALADEWGAREVYPGPDVDNTMVEEYVRSTAVTYHHQVGTCRMGVDGNAVVDPQLRVRGVQGLRVIDASVMPTVTSGNTNAPTAMIAEKGAAYLLHD